MYLLLVASPSQSMSFLIPTSQNLTGPEVKSHFTTKSTGHPISLPLRMGSVCWSHPLGSAYEAISWNGYLPLWYSQSNCGQVF